ncbi:MAG: PHP domain-containing protein [Bacteroidota bacterium]
MYLNARSIYSQQFGTLSIEELIAAALKKGLTHLALTDINTAAGLGKFVRLAEEAGIRPICGVEFRNEGELLYIGLAKNTEGVRELRNFLEEYQSRRLPFPEHAPAFENVLTVYRFGGYLPENLRENEYIGIRPTQLRSLGQDYKGLKSRFVVRQPITFTGKEGYDAHKSMLRINGPTPLGMLLSETVAHPDERILSKFEFSLMFSNHVDILINTEKLLEDCAPAYAAELDCVPDAILEPASLAKLRRMHSDDDRMIQRIGA